MIGSEPLLLRFIRPHHPLTNPVHEGSPWDLKLASQFGWPPFIGQEPLTEPNSRAGCLHADDQDVLRSRSRAHHAPYRRVPQAVVQRILEIRETPPENLRRTPGPRAILYYLRRDQALAELSTSLPRSSCTVWRILRRCGCILDAPARRRRPLELAEPMTNIELDFTDVSSVPSEPLGKKQHGVESFNAIDAGTSTWLFTQVRTDFNAETALLAVIELLSQYGCPKQLTFDRDPRWIGAQQMRTFPSAFVRMLLCLGITPRICPPRRPDKKPFVERLHRTLQEECLLLQHPQTPEAAQEVSEQFRQHYNQERPLKAESLWERPATDRLSDLAHLATVTRAHRSGSVALSGAGASLCAQGKQRWEGDHR